MLNTKDIGERINRIRELEGYSKEELADAIKVTTRFIYDIELGNKGMSIDTLVNLCGILNVSADYLLFGKTHGETTFSPEARALVERCPVSKEAYLKEIIELFLRAMEE